MMGEGFNLNTFGEKRPYKNSAHFQLSYEVNMVFLLHAQKITQCTCFRFLHCFQYKLSEKLAQMLNLSLTQYYTI